MPLSAKVGSEIIGGADGEPALRAQLIKVPEAAIKKTLGGAIPESFSVGIHEEPGMRAHIVLLPEGTNFMLESASVIRF